MDNEFNEGENYSLCTEEGCTKPIAYKKDGLCLAHYQAKRRAEQRANKQPVAIPADIGSKISMARTQEDWFQIATTLEPVMQGILNGTIKTTASQASLIKDIWNRAHGKPVATQTDKRVALGVVILPALGTGEATHICPRCGYDAVKDLEEDDAQAIAEKQFNQ